MVHNRILFDVLSLEFLEHFLRLYLWFHINLFLSRASPFLSYIYCLHPYASYTRQTVKTSNCCTQEIIMWRETEPSKLFRYILLDSFLLSHDYKTSWEKKSLYFWRTAIVGICVFVSCYLFLIVCLTIQVGCLWCVTYFVLIIIFIWRFYGISQMLNPTLSLSLSQQIIQLAATQCSNVKWSLSVTTLPCYVVHNAFLNVWCFYSM